MDPEGSPCLGKGREGWMSRGIFWTLLLELPALHQSPQASPAHPLLSLYPEPTGKGRCPAESTHCAWSIEATNYVRYKLVLFSSFSNRLPGLGSLLDQCWPVMERKEQSLPCFLYQHHFTLWFCPISMHSSTCYKIITKTLLWGSHIVGWYVPNSRSVDLAAKKETTWKLLQKKYQCCTTQL